MYEQTKTDSTGNVLDVCIAVIFIVKGMCVSSIGCMSFDNSVGRAVECSGCRHIHRSLVQVRLDGLTNTILLYITFLGLYLIFMPKQDGCIIIMFINFKE